MITRVSKTIGTYTCISCVPQWKHNFLFQSSRNLLILCTTCHITLPLCKGVCSNKLIYITSTSKVCPLKQSFLFQSISNLLLWSPMWRSTYDNEGVEIDWNTSFVSTVSPKWSVNLHFNLVAVIDFVSYMAHDIALMIMSVLKRFEHTTSMSCVLLTKYNIAFQEIWNLLILYPMWHMILYLW